MITVLNMPPLDSIEIGKGLNIIGTNNSSVFFQLSQLLKGGDNVGNMFDDKDSLVGKVASQILFLGDVASPYSFNDWFMKQMITKLLFNVDENQLKELHEIFERGYSVFDNLILDSMLPVNLSTEFEVKSILGIYKPSIDVPNPHSFYDVLQSIIDTAGALNEKRMLVLLHITKYCTKEQLDYLARDILRQELQVLSLEWTDHLFRFEDGRSWYIDEDFVQFP